VPGRATGYSSWTGTDDGLPAAAVLLAGAVLDAGAVVDAGAVLEAWAVLEAGARRKQRECPARDCAMERSMKSTMLDDVVDGRG